MGTNYLGSESDYIISKQTGHYFGKGNWEAEVDSVGFAFTFAYTNSLDTYTGIIYAPANKYRIGSFQTSFGSYEITGATPGFSADLENRVVLNRYNLGGGRYNVLGGDAAGYFGYEGLGSESAYIISDTVPEYHFADYQPARLVSYAYDFTYSYNNGSGGSYSGTVYATPEHGYYQGYNLPIIADENGRPGSYLITGVRTADAWGASFNRSLDGQVLVNRYHDAETGLDFNLADHNLYVTTGTTYLGSEHGYIAQDNVPQFLFGLDPGDCTTFREANGLTYSYDFTYHYGPVPGHFASSRLTDNGLDNVEPRINDAGWIVYEADWQEGEGEGVKQYSDIYLKHDGQTVKLPSPCRENYTPDINNAGQVVWYGYDDNGTGHIYLYDHGVTNAISDPGLDSSYPRINDAGQVVWYGCTGELNWQIFLYSGGGVTQITHDSGDYLNCEPVINNSGEITWWKYEFFGNDYYELCLYRDGAVTQVASFTGNLIDSPNFNDAGWVVWDDGTWPNLCLGYLYNGVGIQPLGNPAYITCNPQINEAGQVVWYDYKYSESGNSDYSIYIYEEGHTYQLVHNDYRLSYPDINNRGQVVYEDDSGPHKDIYLITPDYYSGRVYAVADMPYHVGYAINQNNELGPGYYVITGQVPSNDPLRAGQVWVSSYFDGVSGRVYVPDGYAQSRASGISYLGSESDTIVDDYFASHLFGNQNGTLYQANANSPPTESTRYDFAFHYANGDYYTGSVYATPGKGYTTSYSQSVTDENGQAGYYTIVKETTGQDASRIGQVYVNQYYDAETAKTYVPVSHGTAAVGTGYLGSECDYLLQANNAQRRFGQSGGLSYEADAGLLHQLPGYIIYGGLYYQELKALTGSSAGTSYSSTPYLEASAINAPTVNQAIALINATIQSPAAWGAYFIQVGNPDEDQL